MTLEDALELYNELKRIFGDNEDLKRKIKPIEQPRPCPENPYLKIWYAEKVYDHDMADGCR